MLFWYAQGYTNVVVTQVTLMNTWAFALMLSSLCVVTVIMLLFVQPAIQDVEANRDGVLSMFSEVPKGDVRRFYARLSSRYKAMKHSRIKGLPDETGDDDQNLDGFFEAQEQAEAEMEVGETQSLTKQDSKKAANAANDNSSSCTTFVASVGRWMKTSNVLIYVVLACAYGLSTYYIEIGVPQSQFVQTASQIQVSIERGTMTRLTLLSMLELCFQANNNSVATSKYHVTPDVPMQYLNQLYVLNDALMLGSTVNGTAAATGALFQMLDTNACSVPNAPAGCSTFGNKILSEGFYAALLRFVSTGFITLNALNTTLSTMTPLSTAGGGLTTQQIINFVGVIPSNGQAPGTNFQYLTVMDDLFVAPLVDTAAKMDQSAVLDLISANNSPCVALLAVFCVLTFALFSGYYIPLIWQMNAEQKRTSALLLMVPAEVMDANSKLQRYVESMLQNSVN